MNETQDYGIDAPGTVRGLLGRGAVCLGLGLGGLLWQKLAPPAPGWVGMVTGTGLGAGVAQLVAGGWMVWSSRVGKFLIRRRLLGLHRWRGDEAVLDVGCGRGFALVGAAERLTAGGHATGIDLWSAEDLSGNRPEATMANAAAAGVAERVQVDTGDARSLPYGDGSFDVVVSMTAIHNIELASGRERALAEMLRVLKPGGRLLFFDIFHPLESLRVVRRLGAQNVQRSWPVLLWAVPGGWLTATKASEPGSRPA